MIYCNGATKSTIQYSFNQSKETFTLKGSAEVTTSNAGEQTALLKFGSSAKVPSSWVGASVLLYGIVFTAPDYPNCPSGYYEIDVGNAAPGQTLNLVQTPRLQACTNAHIMSIPELGFSDFDRQWNGASAGIGLKGITDKCIIQIISSTGQIFTKTGECPIEYTVICGDECPEGSCKCITPGYPGYCCLDCGSAAASIRAITNSLGRK